MTKTCTKCGGTKGLDEFHMDRNNRSDGRTSQCKSCRRAIKAEYLERTRKPKKEQWRIWTYDKIKETALRFSTRSSFQKENLPAYTAARRSKEGLDHFCAHMVRLNERWTFDKILGVARSFGTIKDFSAGNYAAYNAGLRSGRTKELYEHMVRAGAGTARYVYLIKSAQDSTVYVGLSQKPNKRYLEHKRSGKAEVKRLITGDHTFTVVAGPISEDDARRLEIETVLSMRASGFNVLNSVRGGALGALGSLKWTRDAITEEAKKYNKRVDFLKACPAAYCAALRRFGGVDQFCGHMTFSLKSWDAESIKGEAKKYKTRTAFEKACGSAVNAARRLGIMDDVCSHMPVYRLRGHANDNRAAAVAA